MIRILNHLLSGLDDEAVKSGSAPQASSGLLHPRKHYLPSLRDLVGGLFLIRVTLTLLHSTTSRPCPRHRNIVARFRSSIRRKDPDAVSDSEDDEKEADGFRRHAGGL